MDAAGALRSTCAATSTILFCSFVARMFLFFSFVYLTMFAARRHDDAPKH